MKHFIFKHRCTEFWRLRQILNFNDSSKEKRNKNNNVLQNKNIKEST